MEGDGRRSLAAGGGIHASADEQSAAAQAPWHSLDTGDVLGQLGVTAEGLTETEVGDRLERFGYNRLKPPKRRGPLVRLLLQFHNVLIYVLLGAAVTTAFLQHWVDTGVILGIVLVNALIGFVQEGKAEKALAAIRRMLSPQATVQRDGHRVVVAAETLVPGDVVHLQSGDRVAADLRLIRTKGLEIEEAALTGESVPVGKDIEAVAVSYTHLTLPTKRIV